MPVLSPSAGRLPVLNKTRSFRIVISFRREEKSRRKNPDICIFVSLLFFLIVRARDNNVVS